MKALIVIIVLFVGAAEANCKFVTMNYSRHHHATVEYNEKHGGAGIECGTDISYGYLQYQNSQASESNMIYINKLHNNGFGYWAGLADGYDLNDYDGFMAIVGFIYEYKFLRITHTPGTLSTIGLVFDLN